MAGSPPADWIYTRAFDTATSAEAGGIAFDPMNGRLLLWLESICRFTGCPDEQTYGGGVWIAVIEGFATTFEILQSYEPSASIIGFRAPYMPEGFPAASFFDTYYGDLATVGDWSQAQPLQCGYPASAPSVGDYLTVDTSSLPGPAPGQGYYYVTAANYMGQRRYGRQSVGGVLSGRDPGVLPACEE